MTLLIALLFACGSSKPDDTVRAHQAQARVAELFAATASGDCGPIIPLMDTIKNEADCAEWIHGTQEQGLQLLEVVGAKVDGRDPDAFIVRTNIERKGKPSELLVRAEWRPSGWNLVL